ncbi:MAG: lip2 6 [Glaciihabitans sp.]|jgi:acetyl esterase|nr:lip2 6 [Glaciihabitans sp.]MCW2654452.1 lip2 6 [Mycobacterium sp.]
MGIKSASACAVDRVPSVPVTDTETAPPRRQGARSPSLNRAKNAAVTVANRLGAGAMPGVPEVAKRLMARSVTIDGNTLDPTLRLLLVTRKVAGRTGLSHGDLPEICRELFRQDMWVLDREPVVVGSVRNLTIPAPAGPIRARHYRPHGERCGPLLVYLHGGGWVIGDLDSYDRLCRTICRGAGVDVLSVHYRRAPEYPAPAGLADAYAVYRWALEHGAELGTAPGLVAVGGDSAGGNLAAVVSQRGRDDGVPPLLQFLLYPATDLRGRTRSRALFSDGFLLTRKDMELFESYYLTGSGLDAADPRVSPVLGDLSRLPRALVVTAGFDPLRDEGDLYAEAMRDAGVAVDLRRMPSLTHGFANLTALGGGSAVAMAEVNSALRAHLCYR